MDSKQVRAIVDLQQRFIRRSAGYWIEAAERLQNGDLAPSLWLESWARYVRDSRRDAAEGLDLWRKAEKRAQPDAAAPAGGESDES